MTWRSIEEAAENLGITTRTAYRWLQAKKLQRRKTDDGMVFVLSTDIQDDISDTDVMTSPDDTLDDGDRSRGTIKPHHNPNLRTGRSSIVSSLQTELEARKLELEISKIEDAKRKWEARRDKEEIEKVEEERVLKLEEFSLMERQSHKEEREKKGRIRIQYVKDEVSCGLKSFLPSSILGEIFLEVEKILSGMDVLNISIGELITYGRMVRDRVLKKHGPEVEMAARNHLSGTCLKMAEDTLRNLMERLRYEFSKTGAWNTPEEFRKFVYSAYPGVARELNLLGLL